MRPSILALAASVATVTGQIYKGFNYGATYSDGSGILESGYQGLFTTAQNLVGASGFASARLYTLIQQGTANTPTQAIQAAINTKTSLLLGMWASAGQGGINAELAALSSAINQYGSAFTDLIVAISVGSEDLYRISPTGIINKSGVGAGPSEISDYIGQVKKAISGTAANGKLVGHVDTWTAWVNGSNDAVISAADFIGMDAYPYFQNTQANSLENGYSLFFNAYDATVSAAGGKPVWVTETGWPVSGATENQAVPSTQNAQTYWDQVGCGRLFDKINTWWFTLQDAAPTTPNPSFGVVGTTLSTTPLFDLSCSAASSSVPSASSVPSSVGSAAATAVAGGSPESGNVGNAANQEASQQSGPSSGLASGSAQSQASGAPQGSASPNAGSSPATSAAQQGTSVVMSGSEAKTAVTTSRVVVTSCPGGCSQAPVSQVSPAQTTLVKVTKTSFLPSASAAVASSCPASLSGTYEYPHLIVPVSKDQPTTAKGTSYNGTISSKISSIFNFDIPASDSGKTCTLVFLLPTQDQLTTSAFTLSGTGGFDVALLKSPVTEQTTYSTVPAVDKDLGGPSSVTAGSEYVIATGSCPAGQKVSYEVTATGSLDLNYFQDYNPSPIGFFITVC